MQEPIEPAARVLNVLADPTRLHIVRVLTEECQNVSDIVSATGLPQPLVSHHLRVLRKNGLAVTERNGAYTTY